MLAPHELKNRTFQRTMRGYSPAEVDEYIAYLQKNYTELYRLNSELEKKLELIIARNNELSRDSDTVRTALIDAQRAASKIVGEAKQEAELIIRSSKRSCDNILNEFRVHIAEEREKLMSLQNEMTSFKDRIYNELRSELEKVENMTDRADWSGLEVDDEIFTKRIITDIKSDVASAMNERAHAEDSVSYGGPDPEIFEAANQDEKNVAAPQAEPEAIDPPETVPDATRVFAQAEMAAELAVPDGTTLELPLAVEVVPEPLEAPAVSRIEAEPAPQPEAADTGITEEYDLVLEKFAEELAAETAEAPAVEEENE